MPKGAEKSENNSLKVSSKVKEYRPEAILLDFRSIVNTRSIDEDYFLPYIKENIRRYVKEHWCDSAVIKAVEALRSTSLDHKFNKNRDDCPLVDDESHGADHAIKTTVDFLEWQMDHRAEAAETFEIHRMLIAEGLEKDKIKIPIFDDVVPCLTAWKKKQNIPSYIHGDMTKSYLTKIVEHSSEGNLNKSISGIFDTSNGPLEQSETYMKIAKSLKFSPHWMLCITEYGKGAKAANKTGMSVLLLKRPGVRIREYYETMFPAIESLRDIIFIERTPSSESVDVKEMNKAENQPKTPNKPAK